MGEHAEADHLANLGLTTDPTSDFLKEDTGKSDLEHLAADPYRVLRVAAEYMRLGLYRKALKFSIEPIRPCPQTKVSLARYCRRATRSCSTTPPTANRNSAQGTSGTGKRRRSFPRTSSFHRRRPTGLIADCARGERNDATAHYLLGTLLFSKGLIDDGMAHWTRQSGYSASARSRCRSGKCVAEVKSDPQHALSIFPRRHAQRPRQRRGIYWLWMKR